MAPRPRSDPQPQHQPQNSETGLRVGPRRWPFRRGVRLSVGLSALFIPVVLLTGLTVAFAAYERARRLVVESNGELMQVLISRETQQLQQQLGFELIEDHLERLANPLDRTAATGGADAVGNSSERIRDLRRLTAILRLAIVSTPAVQAYMLSNTDGEQVLLRRLQGDAHRRLFQAPASAAYVLQILQRRPGDGALQAERLLLDDRLTTLRREPDPLRPGYDPRSRDWFRRALRSSGPVHTGLYTFATTGEPGFTVAQQGVGGRLVAAADVSLAQTEVLLEAVRRGLGDYADVETALVSFRGRVIAHVGGAGKVPVQDQARSMHRLPSPVMQALARRFGELRGAVERGGELVTLQVRAGGRTWEVGVAPGPELVVSGVRTVLFVAIPQEELLADARDLRRQSLLSVALVLGLAVPLVLLLSRRVSGPLQDLARKADAVRRFDFSGERTLWPIVREVDELAEAMDRMKRTIRRFLSVTGAMAAQPDLDRLMETIVQESIANSEAEGCALVLLDEPTPVLARNASHEVLELTMDSHDRPALLTLAGAGLAHPGGTPLEQALCRQLGGETRPYVAVPLRSRAEEPLGVLLLWFHQAPDPSRVAFIEAFSSTAAVALETRRLIGAQKRLFQAFIELIAGSIDAKSPYTGGHCKRVPELTRLLAEAACEATEGPYASFDLTPERWEALHVAAWLHDCGKVVSPEYVVDKATKLETLHDRIHEVRMRFEVLKRDVWLRYHEQRHRADEAHEAELAAQRDAQLRELDEEFAFVASCNQGGEFLAEADVARLRQIASRTWERTLDDRLGVSAEERQRQDRRPAAPLPVLEPLLADRDEHRIERPAADRFDPANPWGFTLQPTEWLYDRGELHNLSVQRGTLTAEERYKINEHIVHTIRMLSALPFPRHMRDVPELAGGHHETLIGTGYPRGLRRDQMSDIARMMAIADIFEALTAADRPYKSAKTLSEAMRIMAFMRNDQHIDPDLFALFIRSGVYRRYAERFLRPEQCDAVDEAALLASG